LFLFDRELTLEPLSFDRLTFTQAPLALFLSPAVFGCSALLVALGLLALAHLRRGDDRQALLPSPLLADLQRELGPR
jgi:hypothetical protein